MGDENKMADVQTPGLDATRSFQMDAPKLGWGESMMSQRQKDKLAEKIDPVGDLGKFAADRDKRSKEDDKEMRRRDISGKAINFTDPVKNEAGMPPVPKGKFPRQEAQQAAGDGVDHDWKIAVGADANTWTAGGTIYYLNDATESTVDSTTVTGAVGSIYLHVKRDPASRARTNETVEFHEVAPLTGEADQYFLLGRVGGTPNIIQDQFTPIRVYEDLFVINGEFRLGSIAMLADNLYALPAP